MISNIFLLSDDLVSEEMEEDIISELPCTLAIEDSTQDSTGPNETDQVSFLSFFFWSNRRVCLKKTFVP